MLRQITARSTHVERSYGAARSPELYHARVAGSFCSIKQVLWFGHELYNVTCKSRRDRSFGPGKGSRFAHHFCKPVLPWTLATSARVGQRVRHSVAARWYVLGVRTCVRKVTGPDPFLKRALL